MKATQRPRPRTDPAHGPINRKKDRKHKQAKSKAGKAANGTSDADKPRQPAGAEHAGARPQENSATYTVSSVAPSILGDAGPDAAVRWRPGERLHHLFEARCDLLMSIGQSDHPAVVTDETTLTYCELDAQANRTARHLLARGVDAGDRIAVLFDKSPETYVALLEILKVGTAYVPLDVSFPKDRIAFIAGDADVKAIVTLSRFEERLAGLPLPILLLDRDAPAIDRMSAVRLERTDRASNELCYIVYTSGSTGNPKGVAVEQASICNFIRVACEVYGLKEHDRVYQGMTMAFDFSVEELWMPLVAGATLIPGKPGGNLAGRDLADHLARHRVTALCCVPTLLATLDEDLPDLRFLLVSGEACPPELVARWYRPGRRILNAYGPTEATVTATVTQLSPEKPVTIGRPLPTYLVVILDEHRQMALPQGELGEIAIAGIGLAKEYVNRSDLTERAFVDDFLDLPNNPSGRLYRTGDLGRITDDGEVEYHGRIDTQVKIRGYRIELTEIESALLEIPGIGQAAAAIHEREPSHKELVAYYTRLSGAPAVETGMIVDCLRERLPAYMVPAFFEEIDAIPMLASGKADRKNLPAPRAGRFARSSSSHVAPRNDTEELLAQLLSEALELPHVCVHDHFFNDLGCHSLLMAQYCARIRERLPQAEISMRDVYVHPTIADLARCIATTPGVRVDAKSAPDVRKATNLEYCGCGMLQLLAYVAAMCGATIVFVESYRWVDAAPMGGAFALRALACGSFLFVLTAGVPIILKWLLVGRWRPAHIPIWGRGYFRFWLVRQLIRTNPLALTKGSPLYNVYLRLLGARIGRGVVIDSRFLPVCTDLLRIGDNTVLRKDSIVLGYRGQSGWIRTGPVTIGRDVVVGEASVLAIDVVMGDGAQLAMARHCWPGSRFLMERAIMARRRGWRASIIWHSSPRIAGD